MAPRLRMLLLLLPAGCAPGDRDPMALQQAMENGRASLEAVTPASLAIAAPTRPPALSSFVPSAPRAILARRDIQPSGLRASPASAAELLGIGPEALRHRLGEPSLRRPEGVAEVWLYAGEGCALDLVLYPAAGALRVAHAEARASGADPLTEADCLRGLAARPLPAVAAGQGDLGV